MVAKKETAEQKLLRMIESGAPAGGGGTVAGGKESSKKKKGINVVKLSNTILTFAFVCMIVLLAREFFAGQNLLSRKDTGMGDGSQPQISNPANVALTVQRLSYYLANVKSRNIFKPYEDAMKNNIVAISEENRMIARKTAHLKLVGVSWFDRVDTASVMLEDIEKGVTYFLEKGSKIGDVIVKTIYADSVELGYENEEIIIRYDKSQM